VQQFLDQLEHKGLIRREPDPADRRAKRVVLTPEGGDILAAKTAVEAKVEHAFSDVLGKKRYGRLRRALRRLAPSG
jgi:DNA-binding MarR family transcriptional regulator